MKVTYIGHSGFLLETEEINFLFDYYEGEIPILEKEKPLVVLVSHSHHDHYNPEIFALLAVYQNIKFILSDDVTIDYGKLWQLIQHKEKKSYFTLLGPGGSHIVSIPGAEDMKVTALKSTDEGVAFLAEYKGKTIYHAGDLNLWLWEEESEEYRQEMQKEYEKAMEVLEGRKIDAAFIPLDPRLEKTAYCGMEYDLEHTDSNWVFPMHFWEDYGIIDRFLEKHPEYDGIVQRIQKPGETFEKE